MSVLLPKTPTVPNPAPAIAQYDNAGNVASITDPLGNITRFGYDAARHKTSVTTPRGNTGSTPDLNYTTNFGYDADGNQKTVTDPPTTQVPNPAPTVTDYDPLNRAIDRTDPLGDKAVIDDNQLGQIDWVKDGLEYVTKFGYDQAGQRTSVTDSRGNTTATPDPAYTATTAFDFAGNQVSQTSAMGEKTLTPTTSMAAASPRSTPEAMRLASRTHGLPDQLRPRPGWKPDHDHRSLKRTTTTQYDAANRKLSVTDPLGHATSYHFWPGSSVNTVTDPMGNVTAYTYDQAGNLNTRTDANNHATGYTYNAARQLQQSTDPLGRTTKYGYDADGNLATLTDARNITTTITTDARNLHTGFSYSDGTPAVSFTFDAAHHLTGITDATGSQTRTYDPNGRLLSATSPLAAGKSSRNSGFRVRPYRSPRYE